MEPGGWNGTAADSGVVGSSTSSSGYASSTEPILVTSLATFNIYPTSYLFVLLSSYAAASGFQSGIYGFPTTTPSATAVATGGGILTISSSIPVSLSTSSPVNATSYPVLTLPYDNATSVSPTKSAQGIASSTSTHLTSSTTNGSLITSLSNSSSQSVPCTEGSTVYPAVTTPYINSTLVSASSSAQGIVTSIHTEPTIATTSNLATSISVSPTFTSTGIPLLSANASSSYTSTESMSGKTITR